MRLGSVEPKAMMRRVLAIDPSSTRTGYALLSSPKVIEDAGYLTPRRSADEALARIATMTGELLTLLAESDADVVLVEVTSGKVSGRHQGSGAGLAVYGMAVGALWQAVRSYSGKGQRIAVRENTWTKGVSKRRRQRRVAQLFPAYAKLMQQDSGADVADAIGIALWWYAQQALVRQASGVATR